MSVPSKKFIAECLYNAKQEWDSLPGVVKRDIRTGIEFEPGIMWFANSIHKRLLEVEEFKKELTP